MLGVILRRLAWAIPLLFIVSVLTFVLLALTPGDPASTILGTAATPENIAALREQLGLNEPWYVQYWNWLTAALSGDLGTSLISKTPVIDQLMARLPVTVSLVLVATIVSAVFGIAFGVFSAVRRGRIGRLTDAFSMLGFAIPNYWLGLILVFVFAVQLRLLPATGYTSLLEDPRAWLASLVLPVITLSVGGITMIAKNTRDAMSDAMAREFIDNLRAEGWSEGRIVFRHALRNASIPIVTAVGVFFVGVLGGTVLVENVFALPGLGGLAVTSTLSHDIPVLQGVTLFFCIGVVLVNLVVDIVYGLLNPKARTS